MPFASYRDIGEVAHRYRIQCQRTPFIRPVDFALSDYFRSELDFTLSEMVQCREQVAVQPAAT